jgi:hypothetical protein
MFDALGGLVPDEGPRVVDLPWELLGGSTTRPVREPVTR